MRIIALFTLLLLTAAPAAADNWTPAEKRWAAAAATLHLIDWGQTRYIARSDRFYERNPILGRHPSSGRVDRYFLATAIGVGLAAHYMPRYRGAILKTYVVVQGLNVARNFRIGVRIEF